MVTKFFLCTTCGNVIFKFVDSGVEVVCCGKKMQELIPSTNDSVKEKHLPAVECENNGAIKVKVGSIPHPMTPEHHISFIYLETENGGQARYLTPDDAPEAVFCACKGKPVAVYEYCTIHGLWKTDIDRYLGTWYEIARFDHSFERGVAFATANYSLRPNGKITVINSGIKKGKYTKAVGKAKITDTVGRLRVSFFGPFYADYRILMLGEDYSYALVGSKNAKYLWILSRTPVIPEMTLRQILATASARGYDTGKLIWVEQPAE